MQSTYLQGLSQCQMHCCACAWQHCASLGHVSEPRHSSGNAEASWRDRHRAHLEKPSWRSMWRISVNATRVSSSGSDWLPLRAWAASRCGCGCGFGWGWGCFSSMVDSMPAAGGAAAHSSA